MYAQGLNIFDISSSTNPTLLSAIGAGNYPQSVSVSGNYAYVVSGDSRSGTIKIFDISSSTNPTLASTKATANSPRFVSVSGNYAYVADDSGVQIFNISSSTNPLLVGTTGTGSGPVSVSISGNYAYVVSMSLSSVLQVFDVSTPSAPSLVGSVVTGNFPYSISVLGNYAYVGTGIYYGQGVGSLKIFDVSNPSAPTLAVSSATGVFTYTAPIVVTAPSITTSAASSISRSTLTLNGSITDDGNASSTVRGFAWGTSSDLSGVDTATTTESGTFGIGSFIKNLTGLTASTTYYFRAYAVNSAGTSTGSIVSTTTSPPPIPLAITSISPSTGVDIGGTNITITGTGFATGATVTIGGVSATNIVVVSGTTITATTPSGTDGSQDVVVANLGNGVIGTGNQPFSVSISGNYAYVVNYSSNTLQLFDVSTPSSPLLVGSTGTGINSFPYSVSVLGNYAYVVSDNSSKLQIFDVSSSTNPTLVGTIGTGYTPQSVSVSGNYAYVVSYNQTLQIFNVSTPSSPLLVGSTGAGISPWSIAVSGNYAYVVFARGVKIFDVSSSTNPSLVGTISTRREPNSVSVSGNYAYVVNSDDNTLQIFDVSNPSAPTLASASATSTFTYTAPVVVTTPSVTTSATSLVSTSTLTLNGSITDDGNASSTVRGFAWGITSDLSGVDTATTTESGTFGVGSFIKNITGLTASTTYYFRAYAVNSAGTSTGSIMSSTTLPITISGCTNSSATNYNSSATVDDGSCTYSHPSSGSFSGSYGGGLPPVAPPAVSPITPPVIPPTVPPVIPPAPPAHPPVNPTTPSTPSAPSIPTGTPYVGSQPSNPTLPVSVITSVIKKIHTVLSGSVGNVTLKTLQVAGLVGTSLIAAEAVFLGQLSSASEAVQVPLKFIMTMLGMAGLSKRRKPWGSVYDSQTKRPLDPAVVTLLNKDGSELDLSMTDLNGRYGFLPTTGTYRLKAGKTNYIFPSKKLSGKTEDEVYTNLYFGEEINVKEGDVIDRNIPLDPVAFDWNEYAKKDQKLVSFYGRHILGINRVTETLFAVGLLFSTIVAIVAPSVFNIVILCVYVILFFARIGTHRAYGQVIDGTTGKPIPFALVEVSIPGTVISKKVTDILGRYYCLVTPGTYTLSVDKRNSDGSYTNVVTTNPFRTHGIIKKRIVV